MCVNDVWKEFEGSLCCKVRLSMSCEWSVLKELDSVMGEDAKNELEKLARPYPLQIQAMLLLTSPAYNCVKEPMQLTWYQPACLYLSLQLSH